MTMDLLTPEAFSAGTGGKILPSDPRVGPLIKGATAAIRRYCRWHVSPAMDDTATLDGPGGSLLVLPTLHVVAITSITERTALLEDDVDYEWSHLGDVRRLGCRNWTDRFRSIAIDYRHGFANADDLKLIIQQVVANAIASPMGATREQAGQLSVSWSTTAPGVSGGLSLLERDLAILNSYKLAGGS